MAGRRSARPRFDSTSARKPSVSRRRKLEADYQANLIGFRDPYYAVRIETIGELLWILQQRNWPGGLTKEGRERYGKHVRWFMRQRPSPDDRAKGVDEHASDVAVLRYADLHGVMLRYVDLSWASLFGANLSQVDLSGARLVTSDVRAANMEGARLTDAELVANQEPLLATIAENRALGGAPYAGLVVGPRTDLLWIQRHAGWYGGQSTAQRSDVGQPDVRQPGIDWTDVNFRRTSICDVDVQALPSGERAVIMDALVAEGRRPELMKGVERQNAGIQRGIADSPDFMPFDDVVVERWPELLWIMLACGWSGVDTSGSRARLGGIHLRQSEQSSGGDLDTQYVAPYGGLTLMYADLHGCEVESTVVNSGVSTMSVFLNTALLAGADLTFSNLQGANLSGADLRGANLQASNLAFATLSDAKLQNATAQRADLRCADCANASFAHCDLSGVKMNSETNLAAIELDSHVRLSAINWDTGVSLIQVDWSQARRLGEEETITDARKEYKRAKAAGKRTVAQRRNVANKRLEYLAAIRLGITTYLALSIALRRQGLSREAGIYHIRLEVLHRKLLRVEGGLLNVLRSIGSWLLEKVAGYGERPSYTLGWYAGVVGLFTMLYWWISLTSGPHIPFPDLIIYSVTSFHGRGFFPNPPHVTTIGLGNLMVWFAGAEAAIGVVIESTFIATFAHRFLTAN